MKDRGDCFLPDKGTPRFRSQFQGVFTHFIEGLSVETPGGAGDSTPGLSCQRSWGLTGQQDPFACVHSCSLAPAGRWWPRLQLPQRTGLLFAVGALAVGQLYKSKHASLASPRTLLPSALSLPCGPLLWMGCSLYPAIPTAAAPRATYGQ